MFRADDLGMPFELCAALRFLSKKEKGKRKNK
jgi:hypothetical protein